VAAPPVDPLGGARPGDPHLRGDMSNRPSLAALYKAQSTFIRQWGITV